MKGNYDVIVLGAGAAGMMAAGRAAERGKKVLLIEKNKQLGVKLSITGGSRCNITNAEFDTRTLLSHYGESGQFLFTPFSRFGVTETFSFFESLKLPLVVEARKRAFPKSQKASDVVTALRAYLQAHKVTVMTSTEVEHVVHKGNYIQEVQTKAGAFKAGHFILATGGVSHQETGSTGDGFDWLKHLGHTVHTPTPTIVPLRVKEAWIKRLGGKTITNVRVTLKVDGKKVHAVKGDVLCTHFGVSGPLILNMSSRVSDALHAGETTLSLDLFSGEEIGALSTRLVRYLDGHKNKNLRNALRDFLPPGTAEQLLDAVGISADTKVHSFTKEMRMKAVQGWKALPLHVHGLMGLDRAVIADGGVPLTEMDMATFRSKKIRNLSIVGDLLHIRRPSGGYSLQLCWTSGWVAGDSL